MSYNDNNSHPSPINLDNIFDPIPADGTHLLVCHDHELFAAVCADAFVTTWVEYGVPFINETNHTLVIRVDVIWDLK